MTTQFTGPYIRHLVSGGRFKNNYELLNLRALKISMLYKNHIFQCTGKIFCVEFQRVPLKFHTKYFTHTLKYVDFIHIWKFKSHNCFWTPPPPPPQSNGCDQETCSHGPFYCWHSIMSNRLVILWLLRQKMATLSSISVRSWSNCVYYTISIWGTLYQKQVSRARKSDYQSLPLIPALYSYIVYIYIVGYGLFESRVELFENCWLFCECAQCIPWIMHAYCLAFGFYIHNCRRKYLRTSFAVASIGGVAVVWYYI